MSAPPAKSPRRRVTGPGPTRARWIGAVERTRATTAALAAIAEGADMTGLDHLPVLTCRGQVVPPGATEFPASPSRRDLGDAGIDQDRKTARAAVIKAAALRRKQAKLGLAASARRPRRAPVTAKPSTPIVATPSAPQDGKHHCKVCGETGHNRRTCSRDPTLKAAIKDAALRRKQSILDRAVHTSGIRTTSSITARVTSSCVAPAQITPDCSSGVDSDVTRAPEKLDPISEDPVTQVGDIHAAAG